MDLAYFDKVRDKFEAKRDDFRNKWSREINYRIRELFEDFETLFAVMIQEAYEAGHLDGYCEGKDAAEEERGEWI